MLKKLHRDNPDLGYVLVIEGNAANSWDKKYNKDDNYGYTLSYGRALAVYKHWLRKGIDLRKYNTEILIAGSGFNGLYRDKVEDNNKRFTIQIIPHTKRIQVPISVNASATSPIQPTTFHNTSIINFILLIII